MHVRVINSIIFPLCGTTRSHLRTIQSLIPICPGNPTRQNRAHCCPNQAQWVSTGCNCETRHYSKFSSSSSFRLCAWNLFRSISVSEIYLNNAAEHPLRILDLLQGNPFLQPYTLLFSWKASNRPLLHPGHSRPWGPSASPPRRRTGF